MVQPTGQWVVAPYCNLMQKPPNRMPWHVYIQPQALRQQPGLQPAERCLWHAQAINISIVFTGYIHLPLMTWPTASIMQCEMVQGTLVEIENMLMWNGGLVMLTCWFDVWNTLFIVNWNSSHGLTHGQLMACCLTKPSCHLNQYWSLSIWFCGTHLSPILQEAL